MRLYRLFGQTINGPFTHLGFAPSDSHKWVVDVYAASIEQAYALAYKCARQPDPKSGGVQPQASDLGDAP